MGRRSGPARVCNASGRAPGYIPLYGLVPEPIQIRLSDWAEILWHCIFCAESAISIDRALFVTPYTDRNMSNLLSAIFSISPVLHGVLRGKFWGKGAHKSQYPLFYLFPQLFHLKYLCSVLPHPYHKYIQTLRNVLPY